MWVQFLDDTFLGSEVSISELLIAGFILVLGVILSIWFPKWISRSISRYFIEAEERTIGDKIKRNDVLRENEVTRTRKRITRTVEKPLRRALIALYLLIFTSIAILALNIDMNSSFVIFGDSYEVWQFIQFSITVLFFTVLSLFAVDPVLRTLIFLLLRSRVSNSRKYALYRRIRTAMKLLFLVLGSYVAFALSFPGGDLIYNYWFTGFHYVFLIIFGSVVIANLIATLLEPSYQSTVKGQRKTGRTVGRAIKAGIYVFTVIMAMVILGFDPVTIVSSSIVLGFILAFGLQDTIANFVAGIQIITDKPFVIGDRIRVDWGGRDTWGDVKDISLRSTWIRTPEDELIVIPNHLIASSQVWNYTRESPKVAIHFEIGISYDSDWKLAERTILDILEKHLLVMNKPRPFVLMKRFGEFSITLESWFWIHEARDMLVIQSDLLKRIKDSFDEKGVEIPFPYRTIVHKKDMSKPARLEGDYSSPLYLPSTGYDRMNIEGDEIRDMDKAPSLILAPTSAPFCARHTAPTVMEMARNMDASVVALYIHTSSGSEREGQMALRIYNRVAKHNGIEIKLLFEKGNVLEKILEAVENENASMVVMGSKEESHFRSIIKMNIRGELMKHVRVPILILPLDAEEGGRPGSNLGPGSAGSSGTGGLNGDFSTLGSLERIAQRPKKRRMTGKKR